MDLQGPMQAAFAKASGAYTGSAVQPVMSLATRLEHEVSDWCARHPGCFVSVEDVRAWPYFHAYAKKGDHRLSVALSALARTGRLRRERGGVPGTNVKWLYCGLARTDGPKDTAIVSGAVTTSELKATPPTPVVLTATMRFPSASAALEFLTKYADALSSAEFHRA